MRRLRDPKSLKYAKGRRPNLIGEAVCKKTLKVVKEGIDGKGFIVYKKILNIEDVKNNKKSISFDHWFKRGRC
jgi:hypothetical protein